MNYVLFRPMEVYLDPRGPLNPEWRKSTSMWAVGEQDELAVGLRRIVRRLAHYNQMAHGEGRGRDSMLSERY